jgi:hypothetical protein
MIVLPVARQPRGDGQEVSPVTRRTPRLPRCRRRTPSAPRSCRPGCDRSRRCDTRTSCRRVSRLLPPERSCRAQLPIWPRSCRPSWAIVKLRIGRMRGSARSIRFGSDTDGACSGRQVVLSGIDATRGASPVRVGVPIEEAALTALRRAPVRCRTTGRPRCARAAAACPTPTKNLTEARTLGAALEGDPEMSGGAIASPEARPLGAREHRRELAS